MELTLEQFRDVVSEVIDALPDPLQPLLDRFEFDVSEVPPADDPELGIGRERLGKFLERLTLFKEPFAQAGSQAQLREWLRESLLEEITAPPSDDDDTKEG